MLKWHDGACNSQEFLEVKGLVQFFHLYIVHGPLAVGSAPVRPELFRYFTPRCEADRCVIHSRDSHFEEQSTMLIVLL